MSQITVKLDPVIEKHIDSAIRRGEAASRDAYVEQALRDRYSRDVKRQRRNEALDLGIADADAGRVTSLEEAFDKILAELGK